jgi:TonB-dependent starch-binding outer membrane protein SusC
MVKKPSQSILYLKCLKKIMLILGICSFLLNQNSFQVLAEPGLKVFKSDKLQQKNITGRVVDEKNDPMIGVNVVEKGTNNGVLTGSDGKYSITVSNSSAILSFSFVGCVTQDISLTGKTTVDVILLSETTNLGEVVVIGYGTARKKDVTGSVASVNAVALQEVRTSNMISGLKGRAAGIDIVSNSTLPGSSGQIRIRGNRQMATTAGASDAADAPLLVVDGIPFGGSITDISTNDIESIDILKDASATAIYGSRGAGGVILVTTKRGKSGKAVFNYSGYYGIGNAIGLYDVFNGPEYAKYKDEAKDGNGGSTSYGLSTAEQEGLANGTSTDWQDLIYRQASSIDQQLSVSGGTEGTKYSFGGSYYKETGIIPGQDFSRFSLRTTIDHDISKKLRAGINTLNSLSYTNAGGNPVGGLCRLSPLTAPYLPDGTLNMYPLVGLLDSFTVNPLTIITQAQSIKNLTRRLRTFNSLYGEWDIITGLKYRINLGLDYRQDQIDAYLGPNTMYNTNTTLDKSTESTGNAEAWTYTIENLLTYDKIFRQKHRISFTGLFSVQKDHNQGSGFNGTGILADYIQNYNLNLANSLTASNGTFAERGLISYMGRLNYGYDSRYLVTATVRRDGSSVLSPGHQYFTYPAVALAWNISNEQFMKNVGAISNLKLRAGWGVTSNQGIEPYSTLGVLGVNFYNYGSTTAGNNPGFLVQTLANKSLTWASTEQINIGVDFGFFKDRLTGSVELYQQKTKDILLNQSLPPSNGAGSIIVNAGKTKSKGIEVTLSGTIIQTSSSFRWAADINFSVNREEIVALQDPTLKEDIGNGWFVGQPLSVIYDGVKLGIWQIADSVQAAVYGCKPGQIRIQDLNDDKLLNGSDRKVIGNFEPTWIGGMTNRFYFKGFDFTVVAYSRMGQTVVVPYVMTDGGAQGYPFFNNSRVNSLKRDYWTRSNPTNIWPRPDAGSDNVKYSSTLGYLDGSFVKVRSISLGYNLPASLLNNIKISSLRIYVTCLNAFMLYAPLVRDGYGLDPEGNGYGGVSNSTLGGTPVPGRAITVNMNAPPTRQFQFGLNMNF